MRRFLRHFRDVIVTGLLILGFIYFGLLALSETADNQSIMHYRIANDKAIMEVMSEK
jgi:hypothetical protein